MNSSKDFSGTVESFDGGSLSIKHTSVFSGSNSSHSVVNYRGDLSNVEVISKSEIGVVKDGFSVRTVLIFGDFGVSGKRFFKMLRTASNFLGEVSSSWEEFHKSSGDVMFTVPQDFS